MQLLQLKTEGGIFSRNYGICIYLAISSHVGQLEAQRKEIEGNNVVMHVICEIIGSRCLVCTILHCLHFIPQVLWGTNNVGVHSLVPI